MNRWIHFFTSPFRWLLQSRKPKTDRSALLGMYLTQMNKGLDDGVRGRGNQERRDGKYAQNRQRV